MTRMFLILGHENIEHCCSFVLQLLLLLDLLLLISLPNGSHMSWVGRRTTCDQSLSISISLSISMHFKLWYGCINLVNKTVAFHQIMLLHGRQLKFDYSIMPLYNNSVIFVAAAVSPLVLYIFPPLPFIRLFSSAAVCWIHIRTTWFVRMNNEWKELENCNHHEIEALTHFTIY